MCSYLGFAFLIYRLEVSILLLRRHPLRTIRPPPPTAFAELQWGEPRSEAFGTVTRRRWVVFESQSGRSCCPLRATVSTRRLWAVNPNLAPVCQVGEEERGAGREWPTCCLLSLGLGAMLRRSSVSVVVVWSCILHLRAGGLYPPPPPSPSEDHQATPSYCFRGVAVG